MASVESTDNVCHKLMFGLDCLQFSIVHWLVSLISFENPEPTVDMSTQLYCFHGHVILEAGLRKWDVSKYSDIHLMVMSSFMYSVQVFVQS